MEQSQSNVEGATDKKIIQKRENNMLWAQLKKQLDKEKNDIEWAVEKLIPPMPDSVPQEIEDMSKKLKERLKRRNGGN